MTEPSACHLDVLKKHFGHSEFKSTQWEIIHSILKVKKDNCAVMATGYGKSLCYQYPAVYLSGVTVVISPLISLMEDQVLNLKMNNIPACYLGSAQTKKNEALNSIHKGEMRIVYMTPEYITMDPKFLCGIPNIVLIAIDEAHCVSEWGHDFRPSYRHLSVLRETLPQVPILAVTATATPNVVEDICTSLKLRKPNITNTGFDRPNLYLAASVKQNEIMADLRKLLSSNGQFSGSTIIYCPTVAICEKVCEVLTLSDINNRPYHSQISLKQRKEIHALFVKDVIQVVVATCAFGMGIDKPDVRCVIHYGAPKDLSAYYQEIGRAGRDGLSSTCYTFYNSSDFGKNNLLFQSNSSSQDVQGHCKMMMKKVELYLELSTCRRKYLLQHFSDSNLDSDRCTDKKPHRCCDNCDNTGSPESLISCDIHQEVTNFLKVVSIMGGKYGLGAYIKFIRGTSDTRIGENFKSHPMFGLGKIQREVWWKALSRICVRENLVAEKKVTSGSKRGKGGSFWANRRSYSVYDVSTLGHFYLQKGRSSGIVLRPSNELLQHEYVPREKRTVENSSVWMSAQGNPSAQDFLPHFKKEDNLFKRLQELRTEIAQEQACLRYMVVTEKQLEEMVNRKARCREDLMACGLTDHKINTFGRRFLEVIHEVCNFNEPVPQLGESATEEGNSNIKTSEQKKDTSNEDEWEDDAFFGEIDYNQLDQSINDEQIPTLKVTNVETSLENNKVQKTSITEVQVNVETNKNRSDEESKSTVKQNPAYSDETEWGDNALFGELDYNQLDQSVNEYQKTLETQSKSERESRSIYVRNINDLVCSSKKIKLEETEKVVNRVNKSQNSTIDSTEAKAPHNDARSINVPKLDDFACCSKKIKLEDSTDVLTSPSDSAKLSSFKFEIKKVSAEPFVSSKSESSLSLKKKPKSKLSKFI